MLRFTVAMAVSGYVYAVTCWDSGAVVLGACVGYSWNSFIRCLVDGLIHGVLCYFFACNFDVTCMYAKRGKCDKNGGDVRVLRKN